MQVKWFSADKGFGFVALVDGSGEALLPARALEAAGHRSVDPGSTMIVRMSSGPKGQQVAEVRSIDRSTAQPEPSRPPRSDRTVRSGAEVAGEPNRNGVVKWFDPIRGFGFVTLSGEPKDLFLHVSVLQRAGLETIEPGRSVKVAVVAGRKGDEVGALSPL